MTYSYGVYFRSTVNQIRDETVFPLWSTDHFIATWWHRFVIRAKIRLLLGLGIIRKVFTADLKAMYIRNDGAMSLRRSIALAAFSKSYIK